MAAARRPRSSGLDGVVVLDKPPGITSHDAVAAVRRRLGQRRAGHGGTLDPDASGVLVIGLGRATRLLRFASALDKSYAGEIVLGVTTSTLDASGEVTARFAMQVDLSAARRAAGRLTGRIEQVPPMVSAVQVAGRRLYELAREGLEVERAPRPVEVRRFEIVGFVEEGVLAVSVDCSSGTYVRSLAADLGRELGGGAHLRTLHRTAVGPFGLADAFPLEQVTPANLQRPEVLVAHLASATVDDRARALISHGRVFPRSEFTLEGDGPWSLFDAAGELLAIYEARGEEVKPMLVLVASQNGEAGAGEV